MTNATSLHNLAEAQTLDLLDTAESLLSDVDKAKVDPDLLLQINGMLVVVFEFKRMIKATAGTAASKDCAPKHVQDFMQINDAARNVAINVIEWFARSSKHTSDES